MAGGGRYTPAASGALYLEHYLDRPVEVVLSAAVGERVARERVVEVGNLAAASAGFGAAVPRSPHPGRLGYVWAVFTATREVRGTFRALRLRRRACSPRPPGACPTAARVGSYYAHEPA